jgi:hypothetical protein
MTEARRPLQVAGLLAAMALASVLLFSGSGGADQSAPMRITTDTPEYCRQLDDRLARMLSATSMSSTEDVQQLSTDGKRMCNQGEVRGGILRLRQALVLLQMVQGAP